MTGTLRYLLEMDVGGQVLRCATGPVEVSSADGVKVYEEGLSMSAVSALAESVSVTISGPLDGVTWATRIGAGQIIEGARCVLRLHEEGETLEAAQPLLSGVATGIVWGGTFSALRFDVEAVPSGLQGTMPPPEAVVRNGINWPPEGIMNEDDDGLYYPVVFGYPGAASDGSIYAAYRVPLFYLDTSNADGHWLLAEHDIAATDVEIYRVDSSNKPEVSGMLIDSVFLFPDNFGKTFPIAFQDTPLTDDPPFDGVEYWCGHGLAAGGGMVSRRGGGAVVREAVEVIERLLADYSSVPVDSARMRTAAARLGGYLLDGAVDVPINTWEYIERAILPLLPAVVRWSDVGMYLSVIEYDPSPKDVVAYLNADDRSVTRTSDAKSRFDLLNQFRLDYGHTRGRHSQFLTLTGSPEANAERWFGQLDTSMVGDFWCLRSRSRYGQREADPMATAVVWDDGTAARVLRWQARRHALPIWGVQYVGGAELRHLQPGDVVDVTDADMGWAGRLAVVEDVAYGLTETVLELSVVPDLPG